MIAFIILFSELTPQEQVKKQYEKFEEKYAEELQFFYYSALDMAELPPDMDGMIVHPATGGTERIMLTIMRRTDIPILLLSHFNSNSFAAALETYSVVKKTHRILFHNFDFPNSYGERQIHSFVKICETLTAIHNSKLGIFGEPSDWLITSDHFRLNPKIHPHFKKIKVKEIIKHIPSETLAIPNVLEEKKIHYNNVKDEEISKSLGVYYSLRKIIDNEHLDAIAVRCFDLLPFGVTSCLAFSILNEEGIVSACEGDLPALMTMLIASKLTAQSVWMANPSRINAEENTMVLAHCTAPLDFYKKDTIRFDTHMESGFSVATAGVVQPQTALLIRLSPEGTELTIAVGKIITSDGNDRKLCRTQLIFKFNGSVQDWVESTPGNHQILVRGNFLSQFKDLAKLANIKLIEV